MFGAIDRWAKLAGRATPEVEPGSALAGDARKSPKLQVAHAAWRGISHSIDHLSTLRVLLVEAQALHVYAPMTLVRAAMENAATAFWLLEPSRRSERLRRCLKLARYEAKEAGEVQLLMRRLFPPEVLQGKRTAEERIKEIRELAIELDLDPDDVVGRFGYEKVIHTAGEAIGIGGDLAAFTWRLCSGFAHGRYWASFSFLEREVSAGKSGQLNVRLTGDVEKLLEVMRTPFVLTSRSLDLYEQRRRSVLP